MIKETCTVHETEIPRWGNILPAPEQTGQSYSGDQLADFFLGDCFTANGIVTVKCQGGIFSIFNGRSYQIESRDVLRARLDTYLRNELPQKLGNPVAISSRLKNEILQSIQDRSEVFVPGGIKLPVWQSGDPPAPGELLVMANGILALDHYLTADSAVTQEVIFPHDPRLFATSCLLYYFDPSARCPRWEQFVAETFPGDPESVALLQEWFGYNLSNDNTLKSFCMLVGPPNTGKTVITNILTALIGEENTTHIPLADFRRDFKLVRIFGKKANICAEISTTGDRAEQMLKSITGNDRIELEMKYGASVPFLPAVKITFTSNDPPRWRERSEAIFERLKILCFDHPVTEARQNRHLVQELRTELSGIFNWAIEGLKRLRMYQQFTLHERSIIAIREQRLNCNPVLAYASEHFQPASGKDLAIDSVYQHFRHWSQMQGYVKPCSKEKFCREVMGLYLEVKKRRLGPAGGKRPWYFEGLELASGSPSTADMSDRCPENQKRSEILTG